MAPVLPNDHFFENSQKKPKSPSKDILHAKQLPGHKSIESTLIYTQLLSLEGEEYHVETARNLEEACELVKSGFELFTKFDDAQVFHKRK